MEVVFCKDGQKDIEQAYTNITAAYLDMIDWVESGGWCLVCRDNAYVLVNNLAQLRIAA